MTDPAHAALPAIQDFYPTDVAHCYGCGRLNTEGHQIKTTWQGDEAVAIFHPKPFHTAVPGFVYGGLIASLIDCHSMGTASAAALRGDGASIGDRPSPRYVTASLNVTYLRPTPLGPPIEVRAKISRAGSKSFTVTSSIIVDGVVTATGEVVAVRMPESMAQKDA